MIEKNIGNIERVLRILAGLALGSWFLVQPHLNGIEWFIFAVSIMLILNGVFSRCYLWFVLDVNTTRRNGEHSSIRSSSSGC